MKLPALRAVVPLENGGNDVTSLSRFFFRPPQSLKTGSLPLSGDRQGWDHPRSQGGHTGRTRPAASSASPRCCPLRQSLTQPLTGGKDWRSSRVPGGSILTLCVLFQEPSLFFTAAQFLMVPPLKNLTKPASLSCPESPDLAFKPISPVLPTQAKISRYFAFLVSVHFRYNI